MPSTKGSPRKEKTAPKIDEFEDTVIEKEDLEELHDKKIDSPPNDASDDKSQQV